MIIEPLGKHHVIIFRSLDLGLDSMSTFHIFTKLNNKVIYVS